MDSDLERLVAGARVRLEQLESRYPRLKAWLVLAQRQHQVDVFADPRQREYVPSDLPRILTTFPGVFESGVHRRAAEPLAQRILEADRNWGDLTAAERRVREQLIAKLAPHGAQLVVNSIALVELRFDRLDYALIAELRRDDLVDQALTPQTTASIRIVLGTARAVGGLDGGDAALGSGH